MYASSASLSAAWGTLLARVSAVSRVDLDVIEHACPAPLDDLWARDDMGCVLMCGYPWALRPSRPNLLEAHRERSRTLESLLLTRFVEAAPSRFEVFLERQRAAKSAGYTVLA